MGAVPVSLSDSSGTLLMEGGMTWEMLEAAMKLKMKERGRLS